jgi:hypothetical protein
MSAIFIILIGFTTYAMVIIRSNQNPPMNENEPNDFTELVKYLDVNNMAISQLLKEDLQQSPISRVFIITILQTSISSIHIR